MELQKSFHSYDQNNLNMENIKVYDKWIKDIISILRFKW